MSHRSITRLILLVIISVISHVAWGLRSHTALTSVAHVVLHSPHHCWIVVSLHVAPHISTHVATHLASHVSTAHIPTHVASHISTHVASHISAHLLLAITLVSISITIILASTVVLLGISCREILVAITISTHHLISPSHPVSTLTTLVVTHVTTSTHWTTLVVVHLVLAALVLIWPSHGTHVFPRFSLFGFALYDKQQTISLVF
uniref:Uncharacterized protein LOC100180866 n=1 Tax=Phallusia mammillata TaxID=59560 RepID=A0A6F9DGN6_9ASCI|nr:uncharacterized protein LOC100180866 [Phallusia mammillata]